MNNLKNNSLVKIMNLMQIIHDYPIHLLLDILNYRPVQLFYPREKGVSLKICKAKSKLNIVIMIIGYIWLIAVCALNYQHFLVLMSQKG